MRCSYVLGGAAVFAGIALSTESKRRKKLAAALAKRQASLQYVV